MRQRETTTVAICHRCEEVLDAGQTRCSCGVPTGAMSFKDRCEYEVERWRAYQRRRATA